MIPAGTDRLGAGARAGGRTTLAYILAPSHSGSTLLAMLLGSHSEICTVGELKATSLGDVSRYRCSCLREIRSCPFWNGIAEEMADRGRPFSLQEPGTNFDRIRSRYVASLLRPLHRGPFMEAARDLSLLLSPEWRKALPSILAQNQALVDSIARRSGCKVLVDSSKVGIRLKYLLSLPGLDVKVIRLIRDGRAVALTYMNQDEYADARDPSLRGGGTGKQGGFPGVAMALAARQWRRSTEEAGEIVARLDPARHIELRYEGLCLDPQRELDRVFDFLGLPREGVVGAFKNREHHIIGNGMRLDGTREIRLDDRWKQVLDEASLAEFDRVAGRLNRELGYS